MRILIVDDELLIVKAASLVLTQAGHEIAGTAGTLPRALELIDQLNVDAAIVDLNLNGVSAQPALARLSERGITTIVMSGYAAMQRPEHTTPAWFLEKPMDPEMLLSTLEKVAGTKSR